MMPLDIREALTHHVETLHNCTPELREFLRERIDELLDRANRIRSGALTHHDAMRREYLLLDDE